MLNMATAIDMLLDHHFATTDSWMRSQFVGQEDDNVDFDIMPDYSVNIMIHEIRKYEKIVDTIIDYDSEQDSEIEIQFELDLHDAYGIEIKKDTNSVNIDYNHIDHGSNYDAIDYGVMV